MKNLHIAIIFPLLCAGCIITPIPEHAADYPSRAPIKKESLEFMKVGSTRKEEVLLTLGSPNYTRNFEREFIYFWLTESGWHVTVYKGRTTRYISLKYYELLIEFDDIDIVKRFETRVEKKAEYTR